MNTPETRKIGERTFTNDGKRRRCWDCFETMTTWQNENGVAWCEACQGRKAIVEVASLRKRLEEAERRAASLRAFASASRQAIGGTMDAYLDAVFTLRDDPITESAGLTDLAWALLQGGNVSRGDWDGLVKHWLAAALAGEEKP